MEMAVLTCARCLASWGPVPRVVSIARGTGLSQLASLSNPRRDFASSASERACTSRGHQVLRPSASSAATDVSRQIRKYGQLHTSHTRSASSGLQGATQYHDEDATSSMQMATRDGTTEDTGDLIESYLKKRSTQPDYLATIGADELVAICQSAVHGSLGFVLKCVLDDTLVLSASGGRQDLERQCLAFQSIINAALEIGKGRVTEDQHYRASVLASSTVDEISAQWNRCVALLHPQDTAQTYDKTYGSAVASLSDAAAEWMLRIIACNAQYDRLDLATALLRRCLSRQGAAQTLFPTARDASIIGHYYMSMSVADVKADTLERVFGASEAAHAAPIQIVEDLIGACRQKLSATVTDDVFTQSSSDAARLFEATEKRTEETSQGTTPEDLHYLEARTRVCFTLLNMAARAQDAAGFSKLLSSLPLVLRTSSLFESSELSKQLATKLRSVLRAAAATQKGRATGYNFVTNSIATLKGASPGAADRFWLQEYCEKAFEQKDSASVIDMILFLGKQENYGPNILSALETTTLMTVLAELRQRRRGSDVRELFHSTGLLVGKRKPSPSVDVVFPVQVRTDLLTLLTHCGMFDAAISLYARWTSRPVPEYAFSSLPMLDRLEKFFAADKPASQIARNRTAVPSNTEGQIQQSSQVLLALTRAPTTVKPKSQAFEPYLKLSCHVLMTYLIERGSVANMDLPDIAALAQTLSRLAPYVSSDFQQAAVLCIRIGFDNALRGKDLKVKRLMLRSLALIDLPACCRQLRGLKDDAELMRGLGMEGLSPILAECVDAKRYDLAEEVCDLIDRYRLDLTEGPALLRSLLVWSMHETDTRDQKAAQAFKARADTLAGNLPQSSTEVAKRLKILVESGEWVPNPSIMNALVQTAFRYILLRPPHRPKKHAKSPEKFKEGVVSASTAAQEEVETKKERQQKNVENRRAAIVLLDLCATHLHELFGRTIGILLQQLQTVAITAGSDVGNGSTFIGKVIKDVDYIVSIIRWVPRIRSRQFSLSSDVLDEDDAAAGEDDMTSGAVDRKGKSGKVQGQNAKDALAAGQPSAVKRPNKLAALHFRMLYTTYLRLGDALGAAQVLDWMQMYHDDPMRVLRASWNSVKDKKKKPWDDFIKDAMHSTRELRENPADAKKWVKGRLTVPRTKPWWQPPPNR